ncbi:hypothetical protein ACTFRO_28555 [Bacillus cereus group sp. MYBK163-2]|uniref:hypothetical protein n=1 Tax=Bacillus cereus group TaxID=86661 RepID=UPI0007780835|nr:MULTISPECIES: hypothetical protein [Bacillus cereus group]MDA2258633.1 hypothetical protein [Bacillus cereus]MDA2508712.1 hypothetical protein [Bacillus cereus]OPA39759.1 hypothetical protein BHL07_14225 [Bacillus cereus]QBY34567.1 CycB [Bacillus cereus]TFZ11468.1 hypothetical protein C6Y54_18165 [Bacillus cereus]
MWKTLSVYIKLNFKYTLKRKIEVLDKKIFSKLRIDTKKYFVLTLAILYLIECALLMSISGLITNQLKKAFSIESVVYYYYAFLFLYASFLPIISRTFKLITPFDKDLLFKSPLHNNKIYIMLWLNDFIKNSPSFLSYIAIGIGISFYLNNKLSFYTITICLILISTIISYISQHIYISLKVKMIQQGYGYKAFISSIFIGIFTLFVTILIAKLFINLSVPSFKLLINKIKLNHSFTWENFLSILNNTMLSIGEFIRTIIDSWTPSAIATRILFNNLQKTDIKLILLLVLTIIIMLPITHKKSGFWYRTEFNKIVTKVNGWIPHYGVFLQKITKDYLVKVQLKKLFRDNEQLSKHYTFFFIDFSIWMFGGLAFTLSNYSSSELFQLFGSCFIIHAITRDAFSSGNTLFPGHLNFDSDGRSVKIFRLSGTNLYKLYKAKIKTQRLLGIHESLIGLLIVITIFKTNYYTLSIIGLIFILNLIVSPHFSLLPSYISPHYKRQHYTETGTYKEQEILSDSIFNRITNLINIAITFPFLVAYLANIKFIYFYIIYSLWIILIIIIAIIFIHLTCKKNSSLINKGDITS